MNSLAFRDENSKVWLTYLISVLTDKTLGKLGAYDEGSMMGSILSFAVSITSNEICFAVSTTSNPP